MSKCTLTPASSLRFAIASALGVGCIAQAAAQSTAEELRPVEVIIVTGSYIRGTPEDTALPVDVLSAEDLEAQGSPTLVQLVKMMPATSGGSVGESNRFLGNAAGSATVNLRGFGASRTMVLLNGRRLAISPTGTFDGIDINLMPVAAVGSIEVLKDGAAATYGSDAVSGVVNFLTRRDLQGLEVGANYSYIDNSDGDYDASLAWGTKSDNGNVLLTAGYRHRSELQTPEVEWAVREGAAGFALNPFGGWSSASNPGTYTTGTLAQLNTGAFSATNSFVDDGCTELGGVLNGTTGCRFQYSNFDNLVNDEDHYQIFGELNRELSESVDLHVEALWAGHEVSDERVSPAQSTVQFPSPIDVSGGSAGGGTSPYRATGLNQQSRYYIPAQNPGLSAFAGRHCATPSGSFVTLCPLLANGVITSQTGWRPEGYGGNPLFADGADHQSREAQAYRASVGLKGTFANDIGWDTAVTYMQVDTHVRTPDIVVNRLQLALRGLGGPNCNPQTGTPGAGSCLWFNPFSNGIERSGANGAANPFFNPALTNSREVLDWMHQYIRDDRESSLLVADLVFDGELPLELGGGNIAWAAGAQWRDGTQTRELNDLSDIDVSPCVDSADDGSPGCTGGSGPYTFYGALREYDVSQDVYAAFAEVNLPLLDRLDVTGAVRYEDYGGTVGATTNPKVSARWQIIDWVALRASAGSTFRAPSQLTVTPGSARALAQFTDPVTGSSLYRPIDTFNNPDLEPETAQTFNVGLLFKFAGLTASVDYYRFDFEDELTNETGARIFNTMFPSANAATWQCANAALRTRFTFADDANAATDDCRPGQFLGVRTNQINGPDVKTSGFDFQAQYRWPGLFGGELTVGFDGNYLREYERGALQTIDGVTIEAATDRAGTLELLSAFFAYPEWRGNAFASFGVGSQDFRVDYRYSAGMRDRNHDLDPSPTVVRWAEVGSYKQFDATYRIQLPFDTTLIASVQNLTDEEPSFAFSQYNYDYTAANPLGRVFELGVKMRF
jgi:iron complex outermembrane receptor protein